MIPFQQCRIVVTCNRNAVIIILRLVRRASRCIGYLPRHTKNKVCILSVFCICRIRIRKERRFLFVKHRSVCSRSCIAGIITSHASDIIIRLYLVTTCKICFIHAIHHRYIHTALNGYIPYSLYLYFRCGRSIKHYFSHGARHLDFLCCSLWRLNGYGFFTVHNKRCFYRAFSLSIPFLPVCGYSLLFQLSDCYPITDRCSRCITEIMIGYGVHIISIFRQHISIQRYPYDIGSIGR